MAAVNRSALWELITAEKERHGYSYREIETRSNGEITKGDLGFWKNGTTKLISPSKLISLAGALEVPVARVVEAALATSGLEVGLVRTIEDAIAADDTLGELSKRRLLRVLQDERQVAAGAVPEAAMEEPRRGRPRRPKPGESEEPYNER